MEWWVSRERSLTSFESTGNPARQSRKQIGVNRAKALSTQEREKFEARNSKQIQMIETSNFKTNSIGFGFEEFLSNRGLSGGQFVSDFDGRTSDFLSLASRCEKLLKSFILDQELRV